jgi:hypothetical protein
VERDDMVAAARWKKAESVLRKMKFTATQNKAHFDVAQKKGMEMTYTISTQPAIDRVLAKARG